MCVFRKKYRDLGQYMCSPERVQRFGSVYDIFFHELIISLILEYNLLEIRAVIYFSMLCLQACF